MREKTFGGRKPALKCLVGSHNYNLNGPNSDKDYKVFVLPTFKDLYSGKEFSKMVIGEEEDLDVHDIRKMVKLFWKSNVNFMEVLFSDEISFPLEEDDELNYRLITNYIKKIFEHKERIAKMNLPYLWNACIGMHIEKKKKMHKGTEGTEHLVEMFGYDTKQAMHSMRMLMVLKRYADNGFKDFKKAIYFEEGDSDKDYLLEIKNGLYCYEVMKTVLDNDLKYIETKYRNLYNSIEPDDDMKEILEELIIHIAKVAVNTEGNNGY